MPRTIWNRFFIGMALITSFVLLIWIAGTKVGAQNTVTGDWTASISKEDSKLQLNMERRSSKGGRNQMGHPYDFSELQGLTREQAMNGEIAKSRIFPARQLIILQYAYLHIYVYAHYILSWN